MSGLETALLALGLAQSGLLVWLLLRPAPPAAVDAQLEARLAERLQELSDAVIDAGHAHSERVERELRAEVQASARGLRGTPLVEVSGKPVHAQQGSGVAGVVIPTNDAASTAARAAAQADTARASGTPSARKAAITPSRLATL